MWKMKTNFLKTLSIFGRENITGFQQHDKGDGAKVSSRSETFKNGTISFIRQSSN